MHLRNCWTVHDDRLETDSVELQCYSKPGSGYTRLSHYTLQINRFILDGLCQEKLARHSNVA